MNKDGTVYLAEIEHENGEVRWDIIRWRRLAGLSGDGEGWCNQIGIGLKVKRILRAVPLDTVTERLP